MALSNEHVLLPDGENAADVRPPDRSQCLSTQRQRNILLIDSNAQSRSMRSAMLMTCGYLVDSAADLQAVAGLRKPYPDLVLVSVSGKRAAEKVLSAPWPEDEKRHFAFLLDEDRDLCAVSFNGEVLLAAEEAGDFLSRVSRLLADLDRAAAAQAAGK